MKAPTKRLTKSRQESSATIAARNVRYGNFLPKTEVKTP